MAWIELHDQIRYHKKTERLMQELNISRAEAVGTLALLWTWALNAAPDGDITVFSARSIADAVYWRKSPNKVLPALIASGYVDDKDGRLLIHDWDDYTWRFFDKVELTRAQTRKRVREYRERKAALSNNINYKCNADITQEAFHCNGTSNTHVTNVTPLPNPYDRLNYLIVNTPRAREGSIVDNVDNVDNSVLPSNLTEEQKDLSILAKYIQRLADNSGDGNGHEAIMDVLRDYLTTLGVSRTLFVVRNVYHQARSSAVFDVASYLAKSLEAEKTSKEAAND